MSQYRPLAPIPSIEFDRKEAKSLLRKLRAGDADALARAHEGHNTFDVLRCTLADAQLIIAREYGFASWPRLVQYYASAVRQRDTRRGLHTPSFYEGQARALIERHRARQVWAGRSLAAYVPHFYGMSVNDVYACEISEDEARLAVARSTGCPSWSVLLERAAAVRHESDRDWEPTPLRRAANAISNADVAALQAVVAAHPSFLHPDSPNIPGGGSLLGAALDHERERGRAAMQPIITWLVEQGLDERYELNMRLCGHMHMKTDDVRYLLDRGADPRWVAPNGLPVLENALMRYWNGEAADIIAERTVPRKALWIAAGLSVPMLPEPEDDEVLMEAFFIAALNNRVNVLEYMASRGFDVNCRVWSPTPLVNLAVGNAWTPVVECLVRLGADLDVHEGNSNGTARDMARTMWENGSHGPSYRRIVELCGLDPDAILAARDATLRPAPVIAERMRNALALASDDAFRQGQHEARAEHLLFGLLRDGGLPLLYYTQVSGMDHERFHGAVLDRVQHGVECVSHDALPMHTEAQAMLDNATAIAIERRRDSVNGLHLLLALVQYEHGVAGEWLTRFGGNLAKLREQLARS